MTYISWSSDFMLYLKDSLMYDYHSSGLCDSYFIARRVCLVSPTIWCFSVIFIYDRGWLKLWPQSKYKSAWPIFHGLVIFIPRHTIVAGYYGFTLVVRLGSICQSVFHFRMMSKHQWIFIKLGMCIDIVEIWFGIAHGQISSIFDRVICPRHSHIFVSGL